MTDNEIAFIRAYKSAREGKHDTELTVADLIDRLSVMDPDAIVELDWNIAHENLDKNLPMVGYVSLCMWNKKEYEVLIEDTI